MKYLLPVTLLAFIPLSVWSQPPGPPMPTGRTQKVLLILNEKTGKTDTVKMGNFIRLWFWSDTKLKMEQPLTRTDFRKHTYYVESNLMGVTDSALIFLKRSPFIPVPPIPLPIPLPIRLPNKIPMHEYDTIKLSQIKGIRMVNMGLEGAAVGVTMVPAMSIVPDYFTTWPGMMFMQPSMSIVSTYVGDVMFPMHKVNRERKKTHYTLGTSEIPTDTMYYIQKRKMNGENDYEWEVERLERYEKMYKHIKKELSDEMLDHYQGNTIFSIPLGVTLIPDGFRSGEDMKTRISITERKFFFGFATENFITDRHRIGNELTLNRTERFMSVTGTNSISINSTMGMILSNFTYLKWGLKGIYSEGYKKRQWIKIHQLDDEIAASEEVDDIETGLLMAKRNYFRTMLAAEPKPYLLFGVGAVNTTLIKVKGSDASGIGSTDYSQQKFALEGGFGMFTRVGKRLTYDFSAKYIWTPKYSPYIGGLERYSGFRLQLNIGYMSGVSFMRMRRILKMANTNRDPKGDELKL
ncbi:MULTISPECIES: hypothetical protein [unclassified Chitinophaga]|uniref:hypothetical protein n=1 Tax=unclassified Chitinophaga TaxID=2619133 RepID=UPI00117EF091|nr:MULTISPECIES: hypothetical protein [unclassified Chitinophaga]WPV64657.1 hypothetical protein QQL36_22910 [Chitinophaga sp. LS1]